MSVNLHIENRIAYLQLNRPEVLNALSFSVLDEIDHAVHEIGKSDARGLVLTGAGEKAFCAGADINELRGRPVAAELEGSRLGQRVFDQITQLKIPSVAVLHGYAFGGGLELALACTFRVGTARAKLGLPEVKLGLIPGYGGTQRLPRLIGPSRALDMIMSGRTVAAEEAERMGLLDRVVDDAPSVQIGRDFLSPYLKHGLLALHFARQAVVRGMESSLEEGLRVESDLSTLAYRTRDAQEGMSAFLEKRPANFKDE